MTNVCREKIILKKSSGEELIASATWIQSVRLLLTWKFVQHSKSAVDGLFIRDIRK